MTSKRPIAIAMAFLAIWIAILYAGSDRPPPLGFLWLVSLLIACAVAVYLRVPVYTSWSRSHQPRRILRVVLEGFAAGSVLGVITFLFPFTGEPSIPSRGIADVLTWIAVLSVVCIVNTIVLYSLTSVSLKARR